MKQLIIIFMSMILGIYIYGMLIGDEEDSVRSKTRDLMRRKIEMQEMKP